MELPNEAFFTLSNLYYDHCKNVFYPFSWQQLSGKHIHLFMQPISPNYNSKNGVKQIKVTQESLSQNSILCQLLRTKTLASGTKCIKPFSFFLPFYYHAEWMSSGCDSLTCFS